MKGLNLGVVMMVFVLAFGLSVCGESPPNRLLTEGVEVADIFPEETFTVVANPLPTDEGLAMVVVRRNSDGALFGAITTNDQVVSRRMVPGMEVDIVEWTYRHSYGTLYSPFVIKPE